MKRWLSIPECADYIGISENTLYHYVHRRRIPFSKVPKSNLVRFDRNRVDSWLESGAVETVEEALQGGKD